MPFCKLESLRNSKKVLHIGANTGQEASLYHRLGLKAWHVEAIPELAEKMDVNLKEYEDQIPLQACLSDIEGELIQFHVANNNGQSSSMFELGRHRHAYPQVRYVETVSLRTTTIDALLGQNLIDADLDCIIIDAQGAELKILNGSKQLLSMGNIKLAQVEVSITPMYER